MFNAKPSQQPATGDDTTIVAAPLGYSVLYFDPPPTTKPSMTAQLELVPKQTYPVISFRLHGGVAEPITIVTAPPGAQRFLFSGTKVFSLDTDEVWVDVGQWQQSCLSRWMIARQEKEPQPQAPRQLTLAPGQSAVVRNSGFF
jgi:hypothetical protein